jgi:phage terminase small subunit
MTVESNTPVRDNKTLNMRQLRFVTEYVATGNATRSAHLAGYAHPNVQAFRLLDNISVKAAIEAERRQIMSDGEDKLARYVSQLESESMEADQSGTRVRALELLIKVVGGFAPEKQEVTSFHGAFLADLDLEEAVEEEFDADIFKENKDLH